MLTKLAGIRIAENGNTITLKRTVNFCLMQILIDAGAIFFTISVIYLVLNQNPIDPEFLAMLGVAIVWHAFYLRRLSHSLVGKVEIGPQGIQWKHSTFGGIFTTKTLNWDEVDGIYTRHERPIGTGRQTTGFFLKIRGKNGKIWSALQSVASYNTAVQTCHEIDALIKPLAQGKLEE